jgi:DNA polymerase I-like protein with 3'-5' exonuclease and polymerase domains
VSPFGREHQHEPIRGEWNVSDITNHINQGLGADVMVVARVSFANRWMKSGLEGKIISTVHDNIIVDTPSCNVMKTAQMFHETFKDLPKSISSYFNLDWNLPLLCEVKAGNNQKDLQVVE